MNQNDAPLVVKIGGSLMERIPSLMPVFLESTRRLLLVPGGGKFADLVRDLRLEDDDAAHWMAVAAMDQTGWYISSLGIPPTDRLELPRKVAVWLPYRAMRDHDPLPHSWEVTSDTIAAWAAGVLECDLLLLKSVDGIRCAGKVLTEVWEPVPSVEVDAALLPYLFGHHIRATVINGRDPDVVKACLAGDRVAGTVIHPRF
jgi:aspartokinase-like uncharacterized kinase